MDPDKLTLASLDARLKKLEVGEKESEYPVRFEGEDGVAIVVKWYEAGCCFRVRLENSSCDFFTR